MPEDVTTSVPRALYLLDAEAFQKIYGEEERAAVAGLADVYAGAADGGFRSAALATRRSRLTALQ